MFRCSSALVYARTQVLASVCCSQVVVQAADGTALLDALGPRLLCLYIRIFGHVGCLCIVDSDTPCTCHGLVRAMALGTSSITTLFGAAARVARCLCALQSSAIIGWRSRGLHVMFSAAPILRATCVCAYGAAVPTFAILAFCWCSLLRLCHHGSAFVTGLLLYVMWGARLTSEGVWTPSLCIA